jgi:CubicO group peptidase (beta-lactamase class C family)
MHRPIHVAVVSSLLAFALVAVASPAAARGRPGPPTPPRGRPEPPPPAPLPDRLAHPDVRRTPTVTGSPASFAPVTELREIADRIERELPCRSCPLGVEVRDVLADVRETIDVLIAQECPPNVFGFGGFVVAGLKDIRENAGRGRGREARVLRDVAMLERRLTDVLRERALSTLAFLERSSFDRGRILAARDAVMEADRLYEAGDLSAAAGGYADALGPLEYECVLDVEKLGEGLAAAGTQVSHGWAWAAGRLGSLVASGAGGQARLAQNPPAKAMTPQTKVNTASTGKMITTFAALRLLTAEGIGLDSPIGPHLPAPWPTTPYFDAITFRQLLTHTSGVGGGNQMMADGWEHLKELALSVVLPPPLAQKQYENVNLGLFRALIPEILGFPVELLFPGDPGLAAGTIYANHVNDALLAPAGVSTAPCDDPESPPTLYYPAFLAPDSGWETGDSRRLCGGGGWYLSAEDWVRLLGAVRYGALLSGAEKEELYGTPLGWWPLIRAYGTVYVHNGALISPLGGTRNCVADFPEGWQVVLHMNTDVPDFDACGAVLYAFETAWTAVPQ